MLLLPALLLFTPLPAFAAETGAKAAILYEPVSGTVLYEKHPDDRMLIASTTKIMTAAVVLEHCRLSERVEVNASHAAVEGSSMYLRPGGEYTVEDLLYGLLLSSGNDAAAALADHCAGSMEGFAALMNEKAAALGLENTHFANSHGLDAPDNYSSARDLARITAKAMENQDFCRIFATSDKTVRGITYVNHNKLLRTCDGCIGGKTGYTQAAGRILVSCVEREGLRLICVTISDPDDWTDHAMLYDEAFSAWRFIPLPEGGWRTLETVSGAAERVRLVCSKPGILVRAESEVHLRVRLPRFVFAPVLIGDKAGSVDIWIDGTLDGTAEIWYGETIPAEKRPVFSVCDHLLRLVHRGNGVYYLTA